MKKTSALAWCISLFAILAPAVLSLEADSTMAPYAKQYLSDALNIMRQHALNRHLVNWDTTLIESFALAKGAKDPVQTYRAIRHALAKLSDHHSFLLLSSAQMTKEEMLTKLSPCELGDGSDNPLRRNPESSFRQIRRPAGYVIRPDTSFPIGLLVIPSVWGSADSPAVKEYARVVQKEIKDLNEKHLKGWIIDLRGNNGGNMWAMLAGIGPLAGAEILGLFDEDQQFWFYKEGAAGFRNSSGREYIRVQVPDGMSSLKSRFPIAILIDKGTSSSGEAAAIAFRGRPDTKFFGEHTYGLSTANSGYILKDGAVLELTVSVDADRTGTRYENGVTPDVEVNASRGGTEDAIKAAMSWIDSWK